MRYFKDHPALAHDALEMLPSGIALLDEQGVISDLNQRLALMTGYKAKDLVGQDIRKIVPTLKSESPILDRKSVV